MAFPPWGETIGRKKAQRAQKLQACLDPRLPSLDDSIFHLPSPISRLPSPISRKQSCPPPMAHTAFPIPSDAVAFTFRLRSPCYTSSMTSNSCITVDCPPEVLLELHASPEELAEILKEATSLSLFLQGKLSSGLAARWVGRSRMNFLFDAMEKGGRLLDQGESDFKRESSLL